MPAEWEMDPQELPDSDVLPGLAKGAQGVWLCASCGYASLSATDACAFCSSKRVEIYGAPHQKAFLAPVIS